VAIIPNVAFKAFWVQQINFLLIVEKVVWFNNKFSQQL
jgi:hypothetical protein